MFGSVYDRSTQLLLQISDIVSPGALVRGALASALVHGALACENVKMLRQMEIRLCVNCDSNRGQEMRC